MNVFDSIYERNSYRGVYDTTPVPRDDLKKIMAAGLAAPSGCNKQTTSLIAVDDPVILAELRSLIDPIIAETAPAIICVLTQRILAYRERCFNIQDYAAAIENMLLAAVGLGYQSCWVEGHITDVDQIGCKMARCLHVPDDYDLVCFLPIGHVSAPVRRVKKKPFSERAWLNGFGVSFDEL